jgi:hypothetical protein
VSVVNALVVNFGESAASDSGSITVEWDDSLNVDDAGEVKTNFVPGDELYLLVHHGSDVDIVGVKSSSGTVSGGGAVSLTRTQEIGWGSIDDKQNLNYTPMGCIKYKWFGRSGAGASVVDKVITMAGSFPCLALVEYVARFLRYRLQTQKVTLTGDETYPFLVYVYYRETVS